ncbi:regulation of nuclear pre-mRNA domain-containing protein 1b [Phtheirospermum japonicum]|uniref:Regulation of nuclear pre-mRNA domain-containing protein 1b n=1 Tax=Phtheirospermum japonicum TaxID=374723 RepID=A0A830D995_9LAMI|nr:regulation of nuclear pre-mRNA domain-containing protein 1b [Phtheirospermum japonicum]
MPLLFIGFRTPIGHASHVVKATCNRVLYLGGAYPTAKGLSKLSRHGRNYLNPHSPSSRRKGSEFVSEFWKVLPEALKGVYDGGNDNCKKVASRLVGIWEERKVFGSRGQNLKNEVLGKNPSPANNVKSSNPIIPIKVVKRDANSLRIKLAVGGLPERILSAMQLVQDEVVNEEEALDKCRDAVSCVREIGKDVGNVSPEIRVALISQLREALQDQVGIWEERKVFGSRGQNLKNEVLGKNPSPANNVKSSNPIIPIKVVKRDANSLRIKLAVGVCQKEFYLQCSWYKMKLSMKKRALDKCRGASGVVDNIEKQENMIQQCISELEKSEEIRVALISQLREALQDQESKLEQIRSELRVARGQIEQAASIRLQMTSAASASPTINQQPVLEPTFTPIPPTSTTTSLPLFVNSTTEEESKKAAAAAVAAKLAASTSSAQMLTSILSSLVAEEAASMSSGVKRPKLSSDPDGGQPPNPAYFSNVHQTFSSVPPGTTQSISQVNQLQAPFLAPLPPPPPPPANSSANQSMGMQPYGYGAMAFARPVGPPPQQAQQLQQPQQPTSGGYFRPVGVGFYGQSHQPPTTPPIHRQ